MRNSILLILFVISLNHAIAQENKNYFFNEFTVSINNSDVKDRNTDNRIGYGIGAFHYFKVHPSVNLLTGIELNQTSQLKYYEYDGHFSSFKDVTYHFYNLSFRFMPRIIGGNKIKLLFDIGPQLDIPIYSYTTGQHSSFNISTYTSSNKKETRAFFNGFNVMGNCGIGALKVMKKLSVLFKVEYKIGITHEYDMLEIRQQYLYFTIGFRRNNSS